MTEKKLEKEHIQSIISYFEFIKNKEHIQFFNQNDLLNFLVGSQGFNNWHSYKKFLLQQNKNDKQKIINHKNRFEDFHINNSNFFYQNININLNKDYIFKKNNYFELNNKLIDFIIGYSYNVNLKTQQAITFKPLNTNIYGKYNIIEIIKNNLSNKYNYIHIKNSNKPNNLDFLKEIFDSQVFENIFFEDNLNLQEFNFLWLNIVKNIFSSDSVNINGLLSSLNINFLVNLYLKLENNEKFLSNLILKYLKKLPSIKFKDIRNIEWNEDTIKAHFNNCENIFLKLLEIKDLYQKCIFIENNNFKNEKNNLNQITINLSNNSSIFCFQIVQEYIEHLLKKNNNQIICINEHKYDFFINCIDKNYLHIKYNPNFDDYILPEQIIFTKNENMIKFTDKLKSHIISSLETIEINPFYNNNNYLNKMNEKEFFIWQPKHLKLNDFHNIDYIMQLGFFEDN